VAAPIILLGPAAAAAAAVDPDMERPAVAPVAETDRDKVSVSASLKIVNYPRFSCFKIYYPGVFLIKYLELDTFLVFLRDLLLCK
jgi:hypothetical protein